MQKEGKIAKNKKRINLYSVFVRDQTSIFYASDRITNGLIRKANILSYIKDNVFVKIFKNVDREKVFINNKTSLNTSFVEKNARY